MPKIKNILKGLVIQDCVSVNEMEIWDAEAYASKTRKPVFAIKITSIDETELTMIIDKSELIKISRFLLKLI